MYLSRLILNPRSRSVLRDLADCQELHRTVMSAFPQIQGLEGAPREKCGVLHRLEMDRHRSRITLYVQSREEPDWSQVPPGYLLDQERLENPAYKSVMDQYRALKEGAVLFFRLRANPTRKIDTKSGPDGRRRHGRRVELRNEADQIAWLRRKGERGGFELVSVRVNPAVPDVRALPESSLGMVRGIRPKSGQDRQSLTLASVLFEGHLKITDSEIFFTDSLAKGLGPGKAYGLGLLSLSPLGRCDCEGERSSYST